MSKTPLVSVVVTLYNYKRFISDCITSILNQDYKNLELIVVDDCSKDISYERAKKFEAIDKRVRVIKMNKNGGYSKAKNEGIIASTGELIALLDADDMFTKSSISRRVKVLIKKDVDFVYANAITVYASHTLKDCYKMKKPKRIECSLDLYNIHAQTVLLKRDVHVKWGLYDESLMSRSDREMWWRLFGKNKKHKKRINSYYLNECVAYYRHHRKSMWRRRKRNKPYDKKIINMSEKAYSIRKNDGITHKNTRFLT